MSAAPAPSIFASRGLAEHIVRGVIGLVALQQAMALSATHPLQSLILAGTALLAFRGCPVCWTVGLFETLAHRVLARHESLTGEPAEREAGMPPKPCPGCQ